MISSLFLRFAIIFAITGMALGIYMGVAQDHSLTPVHAHINLVGWVSMFLAGLFYRAYPQMRNEIGVATSRSVGCRPPAHGAGRGRSDAQHLLGQTPGDCRLAYHIRIYLGLRYDRVPRTPA